MKTVFLMGACLVASAGARSQENSRVEKSKDGYATLIAAGKAILPGENGFPSVSDNVTPEENLRRQRVAVARNAPALAMLRKALTQNIVVPIPTSYDDLGFENYASFRESERQLRQEADVRLADGDVAGAMDSHLTGIDMGAALQNRAPLIGMLTGLAMEGVARKDIEKVASKLNAVQCREALARLKESDTRRSLLVEILRVEKAISISLNNAGMAQSGAKQPLPEGKPTQEWKGYIANLSNAFDAVIEREKLTYPRAKQMKVAMPTDATIQPLISSIQSSRFRFSYARNLTLDRFIEAALQLRAIKLETGAYPATFESPLDPFGDNSHLIYKRDGDSYLLYSIGPDGKDDQGEELQTIEVSNLTGQKTLSDRLNDNSFGDIVATVF